MLPNKVFRFIQQTLSNAKSCLRRVPEREVGKWGSGEVGKWGSGEVGKLN
ncbi:hypothetical protein [Microcystis sp. LE19-84.1B]|nr:hypothetical protein [Microcystis sp. LE19-84.1B]